MKIISLLSLLLLWSTSCLAGCSAMMGNFGTAILMGMGGTFLACSIISLILITCFYRLILKDKTTPLKTFLKASILALFIWSPILFFLIFASILYGYWPIVMIGFATIIVITAMPIYTFLFLRKKQ